jgi:hypothetical protein
MVNIEVATVLTKITDTGSFVFTYLCTFKCTTFRYDRGYSLYFKLPMFIDDKHDKRLEHIL